MLHKEKRKKVAADLKLYGEQEMQRSQEKKKKTHFLLIEMDNVSARKRSKIFKPKFEASWIIYLNDRENELVGVKDS